MPKISCAGFLVFNFSYFVAIYFQSVRRDEKSQKNH